MSTRSMPELSLLMCREMSWIGHFCSKDENRYMCEVDEEWIRDSFNLYGLDNECPHYKQALNRILDSDMSSSDSSSGKSFCLISSKRRKLTPTRLKTRLSSCMDSFTHALS